MPYIKYFLALIQICLFTFSNVATAQPTTETSYENTTITIYLDFSKEFIEKHQDELKRFQELILKLYTKGFKNIEIVNFDGEINPAQIMSEHNIKDKEYFSRGKGGNATNLINVLNNIQSEQKNSNKINIVASDFVNEKEDCHNREIFAKYNCPPSEIICCLETNRQDFLDHLESNITALNLNFTALIEFDYEPSSPEIAGTLRKRLPIITNLNTKLERENKLMIRHDQVTADIIINAYNKMVRSILYCSNAYYSKPYGGQLIVKLSGPNAQKNNISNIMLKNTREFGVNNSFKLYDISNEESLLVINRINALGIDINNPIQIRAIYKGQSSSHFSEGLTPRKISGVKSAVITHIPSFGGNKKFGISIKLQKGRPDQLDKIKVVKGLLHSIALYQFSNIDSNMLWTKLAKNSHINDDTLESLKFVAETSNGDIAQVGSFTQHKKYNQFVSLSIVLPFFSTLIIFIVVNIRNASDTQSNNRLMNAVHLFSPHYYAVIISIPNILFTSGHYYLILTEAWSNQGMRVFVHLVLAGLFSCLIGTCFFLIRRGYITKQLAAMEWTKTTGATGPLSPPKNPSDLPFDFVKGAVTRVLIESTALFFTLVLLIMYLMRSSI